MGFLRSATAAAAAMLASVLAGSQASEVAAGRAVSFRNDIVPLLSSAGCNMGACHGNASGKGGFKLSLRGDDPAFDLHALTRESYGRRVSVDEPPSSLIVLKPTGQVPHEGGIRFAASSPEAKALRDWIAAGAADDEVSAPRLKAVHVEPTRAIVTAPGSTVQLRVTADLDDGSVRDVTRQCAFDLSDPTLAEVSPTGLVRASRRGEVAVAVRYLKGRGVSRLAFLPDRPSFAWAGPPPREIVDERVFARLKSLRVNPSPLAPDHVFLRRAYLDTIGRLPEPEETRSFLADEATDKRPRLVESLVARPEFADFWALKWADLLRNEEKTMGDKGVWVFQRWLRDALDADTPLDELAGRIVAGRGSTWANPPASFHRTNRDPQAAAEAVAQVFLGVRLQCARCHNHPFDDWTQDDYYGLAACFSNVRRKEVNNARSDNLDKHEVVGDEIVFARGAAFMLQPRTRERLEPKPPGGPCLGPADGAEALDRLAAWLTKGNRQFARNMANRIWFHLMGRGLVEPVDDFRASNPPSDPELVEALADELTARGMRLKPLVVLIMNSAAYQLDGRPLPGEPDDPSYYSHAAVRLLPAEVLLDAMSQVTGIPDRYKAAPSRLRAVQLPGIGAENPFLKAFGKPERLLTCECERAESTTLAQAFQMINGPALRKKLAHPENRIGRLLARKAPPEGVLEELYLAALCRRPTAAEARAILAHVGAAPAPFDGWQDAAWAVLNSKEFLLRH
ncbi:hypothetical protein OJF2_56150 [Aquisphaera giovannonii]|uniref:Bacterial Ig-like domain (Group 2) n=1 Tax=Aquisphaera giovannonii TaxID=406548 RepID=A0A5B9WAX3_9BACT|nr:DUF1549 domain-containing protein [Aquisphaera giovannonii]QEH37030.1 hypothetical protein OJF2_56150 [Aquisphaera giovannonii]